jgi:hypothetical protein
MKQLTSQMRESFENLGLVIDALFANLPVETEVMSQSAKLVAKWMGDRLTAENTSRHLATVEELGILSRRLEYNFNDIPGRHWHYTLHGSHEEAKQKLAAYVEQRTREHAERHAKGMDKMHKTRAANRIKAADRINGQAAPEPVADEQRVVVAKRDSEVVRAVAGPEGESALAVQLRALREPDESYALTEAARQYANRSKRLFEQIAQLEATANELGVSFDKTKLVNSMHFDTDARLDAIVPLLPYIDRLEARVARQGEQLVEQRRKYADYDAIKAERDRLAKRIEQIIAANVVASRTEGAHR